MCTLVAAYTITMPIHIKRVYEPAAPEDGFRILVDRLWPRGMKKEDAQINKWLKEVAPSTELRKWVHSKPEEWKAFIPKYKAELKNSEALKELKEDIQKHKTVTLVYAAKDEEQNHAIILRDLIK